MNRLRHGITAFFGFSRTETNAFLILLPLLTLIITSAPLYRIWKAHQPLEPYDAKPLDSLVASWKWEEESGPSARPLVRFLFNPNTASAEDLAKLGFPQRLVKNLIQYRSKGGKFLIRSDLGKLYGMDSQMLDSLYSYIDLPTKIIHRQYTSDHPFIRPKVLAFDINTADSSQFIPLYGIGPSLSRRIIRYRERLGGFVSVDQLSEVFGLDSATLGELKKRTFIAPGFRPRLINVNTADEKTLHSLPYIKFHLAKSIAAYRFQHGDFASVDDLRQLALIDDDLFQRIKPYLTVNE